MANSIWSDQELYEALIAYMEMLQLEEAGQSYSKTEFRNDLLSGALSNRTHGSIEYRWQNISSFLRDRDLNWIDGYKPAENIGSNVETRLERLFRRYDIEYKTSSLELDHQDSETKLLTGQPISYSDFGDAPNDNPSELQTFAKKIRRGQAKFRSNLLGAYGSKCVITGEGPEEVLEAVHIVPHSVSGINELDNGLLMRADLHHLFDDDLLSINPITKIIEIDNRLQDTSYWKYNGNELRRRDDGSQVSDQYLQERLQQASG